MGALIRFGIGSIALACLAVACDSSNTTATGSSDAGTGTGTGTNTGTGTGTGTSSNGGPCTTPAACGGSLDGTWQVNSTCFDGDITAAVAGQLGLPAACNSAYQSITVQATGTVSFANGVETDNVATTITMGMVFTSACYSAMAGSTVTLTAAVCSTLQTSIAGSASGNTATCMLSGGNCNCTVIQSHPASGAQSAYTISGNTIVPSDGSEPIGYCVAGTTLTASQVATDLGGVTLVYTFHKQ